MSTDAEFGTGFRTMDLRDIVILNDSPNADEPGDVNIYMARSKALEAIEPLDLEGASLHAVSGDGRLLTLVTDGETVEIKESSPEGEYDARAYRLASHLADVLFVRGKVLRPPGGSIEDIIRLVEGGEKHVPLPLRMKVLSILCIVCSVMYLAKDLLAQSLGLPVLLFHVLGWAGMLPAAYFIIRQVAARE